MKEKLKSRKFLNAIVSEIAGLVALFYGAAAGDRFLVIAGAALSALTVLGYLKAEGDIDKEGAGKREG